MINSEISLRIKQEIKIEFLSQSKSYKRNELLLPKPIYFFTRHVAPNQSRRPKVHIVHLETKFALCKKPVNPGESINLIDIPEEDLCKKCLQVYNLFLKKKV